jgi:ABC-type protease/lipase transport system fused ATPase/permease subunit
MVILITQLPASLTLADQVFLIAKGRISEVSNRKTGSASRFVERTHCDRSNQIRPEYYPSRPSLTQTHLH